MISYPALHHCLATPNVGKQPGLYLDFMAGHRREKVGAWSLGAPGRAAVRAFADFEEAFYHSAVNFTTLDYGDIVMSRRWRLLGPLGAVKRSLMLGLSAVMLFSVLGARQRQWQQENAAIGLNDGRAGHIPLADSTTFTTLFGGTDSLAHCWNNIATM